MEETKLVEEASKAAIEYLKSRWDGLDDIEKKHIIANAFAHGFVTGYKAHTDEEAQKDASR